MRGQPKNSSGSERHIYNSLERRFERPPSVRAEERYFPELLHLVHPTGVCLGRWYRSVCWK
jgi:hypothetical protein